MVETIFNQLNNKEVKIKIMQDILNLVDSKHIRVLQHKIVIPRKIILANQNFSKIIIHSFCISRSAVYCTLKTNKFVRAYYFTNFISSLSHSTYPTIILQICFKPSDRDLYDLIFNTKKSLFFAMKNNSELIKYIINKNLCQTV